MAIKDLGAVTAYAYAVEGGYTGTEEEFKAMLGEAGFDAVANTLPAGSQATASYQLGRLTLGIPRGDKGEDGEVTEEFLAETLEGYTKVEVAETKADAIVKTASGEIASFTDGGDDLPVKSLKVNIVPTQSGSGDPSPSNVRSISGWSEVKTNASGVNLMPTTLYDGFGYNLAVGTSVTPTPSSRTLTDNGDGTFSIAFTSTWQNGTTIQTLPSSGTLHFVATVTSTGNLGISMYLLDKSYTVLATVIGNSNPANFNAYINLENYPSAEYVAVAYTNRNTANVTLTITEPRLTVGISATSYEPYQGTTYTTSLGQTVYGGTLDVVSGELTVDMKYDQMTYSYLSGLNSSYIGYSAVVTPLGSAGIWVRNWNVNDYIGTIKAGGIKSVCNAYPTIMNDLNVFSSQYRVYFGVQSGTTVDDFLSAVQTLENNGQGLWLAYEIANPTTIQLTPTEVKSLLGSNNIWADAGTVEVEYRADTTLAYNELLTLIASL